jgi:hypothetical protein
MVFIEDPLPAKFGDAVARNIHWNTTSIADGFLAAPSLLLYTNGSYCIPMEVIVWGGNLLYCYTLWYAHRNPIVLRLRLRARSGDQKGAPKTATTISSANR